MPSETAQASLLRSVYARAGVAPEQLTFFEMHGTGTPAGDPIEAAAVGHSLGQSRSNPLPIGSVKTNIGHLEPASGMAGLLKAALALDPIEFRLRGLKNPRGIELIKRVAAMMKWQARPSPGAGTGAALARGRGRGHPRLENLEGQTIS